MKLIVHDATFHHHSKYYHYKNVNFVHKCNKTFILFSYNTRIILIKVNIFYRSHDKISAEKEEQLCAIEK